MLRTRWMSIGGAMPLTWPTLGQLTVDLTEQDGRSASQPSGLFGQCLGASRSRIAASKGSRYADEDIAERGLAPLWRSRLSHAAQVRSPVRLLARDIGVTED